MEKNRFSSAYRLGILGGGQLGRMIIQEANNYNLGIHIMDSDPGAPSAEICSSFTIGNINDYEQVLAFGSTMDTLSVEIENVNVAALYALEEKGVKVFPQPRVLEIIKDKALQKQFYLDHNIPTANFELFTPDMDTALFIDHLPFVMKLRTGGYDGRGVEVIRRKEDMQRMFDEPSIIERYVPYIKELSVIVARNEKGETAVYPVVECEFNDANLVAYLFSPADIDSETEAKACQLSIDVITALDMIGILAVELFLTEDGDVLVNEIAPRPHNSGHHTIECNVTSQFEQHLRAVLNFPLGNTEAIRAGAMLNLLGEAGYEGPAVYEGIEEVMSRKNVHIHLYGKEETRHNRKMGHVTITGATMEEIRTGIDEIKGRIRIISNLQ